MKPYDFEYVKATSLPEVFSVFEEYGDGAKILAGGQSLLASLNMRLSAPKILIDINDLDELRGISITDEVVRIGALTRHVEISRSAAIGRFVPLLSKAIVHVAHPAIRNRGTIGGSIAFADPAAELPACAVALDATFTLVSRNGKRTVPARDFFRDLYKTALEEGEILQYVDFPVTKTASRSAFREFARRQGDFAQIGVALDAHCDGDVFQQVSPVFFAAMNTPIMANNVAECLRGERASEAIIEEAVGQLDRDLQPIGDLYTPADMKRYLAKVFLKEVLIEVSKSDGK